MNQLKKEGIDSETALLKLPNFSYMIENMVMFTYKDTVLLMISFENKSVQIFEYESGESIFEFDFKQCARSLAEPEPDSALGSGLNLSKRNTGQLQRKMTTRSDSQKKPVIVPNSFA